MSTRYLAFDTDHLKFTARKCMTYVLTVSITAIVVSLICSPHTDDPKSMSAEETRGMIVFGISFCVTLFSAGALLFSRK